MKTSSGNVFEYMILTFFCTLFPVLFTIFCLPIVVLIQHSKYCTSLWVRYCFHHLIARLIKYFNEPKEEMFWDLVSDPNSDISILEVGIGYGANFDFYPRVSCFNSC